MNRKQKNSKQNSRKTSTSSKHQQQTNSSNARKGASVRYKIAGHGEEWHIRGKALSRAAQERLNAAAPPKLRRKDGSRYGVGPQRALSIRVRMLLPRVFAGARGDRAGGKKG